MRMEVPLDPVRKPLREHRTEPIETGGSLAHVDGWHILAMLVEGRITVEQAALVNSDRIRQARGLARRKAAA